MDGYGVLSPWQARYQAPTGSDSRAVEWARAFNRSLRTPTMVSKTAKFTFLAVFCAGVFFWGLLIWPTPFFFERLSIPEKLQEVRAGHLDQVEVQRQHLYRITRFTGASVEVINPQPAAN